MHSEVLEILRRISEIIATGADCAAVLPEIVNSLARSLAVDVCSVYTYNERRELLELAATFGLSGDAIGSVTLRPGEGLTGLCFSTQEALNLSDPEKHPNFKLFENTGELQFKSFMSVPLNVVNKRVGVLVLQRRSPEPFPKPVVDMVMTLSVQLANVIVNASMMEQLARQAQPPTPANAHTQPMRQLSRISNYHILQVLGEGNVGVVFRCERLDDHSQFALKLLKTRSGQDAYQEAAFQRFINEANAISQLNHPNIVRFIEFGRGALDSVSSPYIVMELCQGKSLGALLAEGVDLPRADKLRIIRQVASAIAAVHAKNILHRDIKPDNIIVDASLNVKVTDFGVCHLPSSNLTTTSDLVGTPCYLAPEYLLRGQATPSIDIYALGVVAYELLLGRRPYNFPTASEYVARIQRERPPEPKSLDPDFPPNLQRLLARALKQNPKARFKSAADFVTELDLCLDGKSSNGVLARLAESVSSRDWQ